MQSRRLLKKVQETMEDIEEAVCRAQGAEERVQEVGLELPVHENGDVGKRKNDIRCEMRYVCR